MLTLDGILGDIGGPGSATVNVNRGDYSFSTGFMGPCIFAEKNGIVGGNYNDIPLYDQQIPRCHRSLPTFLFGLVAFPGTRGVRPASQQFDTML
jgi:hypothetical protein